MKKSTLALSVAAALGGLGFVSSALAISAIPANGVGGALNSPAGSVLAVNNDGIGHQLVFPYFTAQSDNATLINITNTDLTNGKVVKVRFRGAANSDDLYDFQLLLSPGDVWTASITKDVATGLAKLTSADKSCVVPATANNATFVTGRTDPQAADKPNQTREGYIEVLNMADVPPNTGAAAGVDSLYEALKHVAGVAPCTATVIDAALGNDVAPALAAPLNAAPNAALNVPADLRGLARPTTGLTGDWIILNQLNTAAWSGAATALQVTNAGVAAPGNIVFWPQKFGTPLLANTPAALTAAEATADPLFRENAAVAPVVAIQNYDLPDLSTPYADRAGAADTNATTRADATTSALAVTSLKHQISTNAAIGGVTDVVMSQPTRRYHVGVNYAATAATANSYATTGTLASAIYRTGAAPLTASTYYTVANTGVTGRQVCINNINAPGVQGVFDREETSPTVGGTAFVISPNVPTAATVLLICGEASVVSINAGGTAAPSGALSGTVARSDVTFATGYADGWATWNLANAGVAAPLVAGYPVLGATFQRARNGTVNYGFAFTNKVTR